MKFSQDDEYQDSRAPGSLAGASVLWRRLLASRLQSEPQRLGFRLRCSSESDAELLAATLRQRDGASARVHRIESLSQPGWCIQGETQSEIQSLANLEDLFTWLRQVAHTHQVELHQPAWSGSQRSAA